MKILKFGGSSVAKPERIRQVASIVENYKSKGELSVVVSALGGVTDMLIDTAKKAKNRDESYLDQIEEIESRHLETIDELIADKDHDRVKAAFLTNFSALKDILKGVYLLKELSNRTLDQVMAFGEMSSAFIISQFIDGAKFLDARKLIVTDSNFGNARVNFPL